MKYNIAGIIADFDVQYPRLKKQIKNYEYNGDAKANIKVRLSDEFYDAFRVGVPNFDNDSIEYMCLGSEYYNVLIHFNGMMLHSSCVVYENKAYLFSAASGTGKSTHTQLWLKRFPGSYILNDDKPAIRITDKGIYAYGTPFSGKTDLNVNTGIEIGGICVVKRCETNHIEKITTEEALFSLLNQTVRPSDEDAMDKLLDTLDKVVRTVPIYRLSCNMDISAAEVAYNGMNTERNK